MAKKMMKNLPLGGRSFGSGRVNGRRTVQVGRQSRFFHIRSRNVQSVAYRPNSFISGRPRRASAYGMSRYPM